MRGTTLALAFSPVIAAIVAAIVVATLTAFVATTFMTPIIVAIIIMATVIMAATRSSGTTPCAFAGAFAGAGMLIRKCGTTIHQDTNRQSGRANHSRNGQGREARARCKIAQSLKGHHVLQSVGFP
ncbi:hypothetical protein [Nioella sp. MMSF_3534]|uniref:hypothetical protein n=1 Tax=Nioella sp. MMSF_3534 TaxID=3046720 RepID=UPI00273F1C78|nr:hypothetical protein [Nioella sp. MMSF_3534]